MQRSPLPLIASRLSFLAIVVLIVPVTALVVRRAKAEQLLGDAIDLTLFGPVASVARGLQARQRPVRAEQIRQLLDFYGLKKTTP